MRQKHLASFNSITLNELKVLRDFLEPLKNASDELEGSKYPTLHLVHPWYHTILRHFQPNSLDPEMISRMKTVGLKYWVENVRTNITSFHDIAVSLHPEMKDLRFYTEHEKRVVWNLVEEIMVRFPQPPTESRFETERTSPQPRKRKISKAMEQFISVRNEDDASQAEPSELEEYKSLKIREEVDSLLEWWERNKTRFPRLYGVARFIHAVPASSAAAERLFSKAGRLVHFRPSMRSCLVDDLLFLQSNIEMFNNLKMKFVEEESSRFENEDESGNVNESFERNEDEFINNFDDSFYETD